MRPTGLARLRKNLDRSAFETLGHVERFTDHGAHLVEVFVSDNGTVLAPVEPNTGFVSVLSDGTVLETRPHVALARFTVAWTSQPRRGYLLAIAEGGFAERLALHRRRVSESFTAHGRPRRFSFIDDAKGVLDWVKRAALMPVGVTMFAVMLLAGLAMGAVAFMHSGVATPETVVPVAAAVVALSAFLVGVLPRWVAPRLRLRDRRA
ncbi:MAG: hypothetical protein KDA24_13620 [Deltaproteobacteria bacterium]|nr:hypothetical protein [Deltaproteobacteria bacterium]